MSVFWPAVLMCAVLLLFVGYERWVAAAGEELDRAFGGPLTDDAEEYMAPLRPGARLRNRTERSRP